MIKDLKRKELFPIFNLKGKFLYNVTRDELYQEGHEDSYYRIVHNLVYLPDNGDTKRIWVQKRGPKKYLAGYLVSTASGHLEAGETPMIAILREVQEELFSNVPTKWKLRRLGSDFFLKPNGVKERTKRISVFVSESDGSNFSPSPIEVDQIYAMSLDELKALARDPSSLLVPDFRAILLKKF